MGDDPGKLAVFVRASTRLTHTDERAEAGALAVALAASSALRSLEPVNPSRLLGVLRSEIRDEELLENLDRVEDGLTRQIEAAQLARELGLAEGVTGYIHHTVPMALFCWLRSPSDFRKAVEDAVHLGGDTDTTGAIVGGLAGATVGASAIPPEWLSGLMEWPRSVRWMSALALRLSQQFPESGVPVASGPLRLFWPAILARNLFFTAVVLAHGLRRLLPPY